ncbi:hypothetical protein D9758_005564 [Tetrapyrgos nigripes]|uniref:NADH:flavin oxidoreductase/NADH oxidase N-terminal domain-containing protein n=1 Tax=Tetrapyrgos nigripes TaxID=182062 RepID=A0A8H5GH59_9AGAR|nr:hypothetical protein D9758_005564 [Tetrapyrgos nigripes]
MTSSLDTSPFPKPKLFQPTSLGSLTLQHRIVLAPLTRMRSTNDTFTPLPIVPSYYAQRASVPGTFLISEGTAVTAKGLGWPNTPGIWSDEQIKQWKNVTNAVHERKSFIFSQLFAAGRVVDPTFLKSVDPSFVVSGPSDIPLSSSGFAEGQGQGHVHPLTIAEIKEYVRAFGQTAKNAVEGAGFDGVEVHLANGYLLDQFLQDTSNQRTDEYGGSVENRTRFPLEVVEEVVRALGGAEEKVGIRLSPWSAFQDMRMKDPKPTFAFLTRKLKESFPNLAYLHVIEPRISGASDVDVVEELETESNDFLREIWAPKPFISAGGYNRESAIKRVEEHDGAGLIAFGRLFISNPDLPFRLSRKIPLASYDRQTFYSPSDNSGKGYTDYSFSEEFKESKY